MLVMILMACINSVYVVLIVTVSQVHTVPKGALAHHLILITGFSSVHLKVAKLLIKGIHMPQLQPRPYWGIKYVLFIIYYSCHITLGHMDVSEQGVEMNSVCVSV